MCRDRLVAVGVKHAGSRPKSGKKGKSQDAQRRLTRLTRLKLTMGGVYNGIRLMRQVVRNTPSSPCIKSLNFIK
jgi:hypothetical protein